MECALVLADSGSKFTSSALAIEGDDV